MLKQIKLGFLAVLTVAALSSCKNDAPDTATDTAAVPVGADAAGAVTPTPGAGITATTDPNAAPAEPAAPTGPTTTMSFTETEFNFGKVKAGEKVQHDYVFKNTGKEPLVISNAKGSCGCTVPEWPKEPIAPGASAKIKVEFDSKGKSGPQTKQVTITANTDPVQSIIYIKGDVIGDPAAAAPAAGGTAPQKQ
jgi:predicted secreted protein